MCCQICLNLCNIEHHDCTLLKCPYLNRRQAARKSSSKTCRDIQMDSRRALMVHIGYPWSLWSSQDWKRCSTAGALDYPSCQDTHVWTLILLLSQVEAKLRLNRPNTTLSDDPGCICRLWLEDFSGNYQEERDKVWIRVSALKLLVLDVNNCIRRYPAVLEACPYTCHLSKGIKRTDIEHWDGFLIGRWHDIFLLTDIFAAGWQDGWCPRSQPAWKRSTRRLLFFRWSILPIFTTLRLNLQRSLCKSYSISSETPLTPSPACTIAIVAAVQVVEIGHVCVLWTKQSQVLVKRSRSGNASRDQRERERERGQINMTMHCRCHQRARYWDIWQIPLVVSFLQSVQSQRQRKDCTLEIWVETLYPSLTGRTILLSLHTKHCKLVDRLLSVLTSVEYCVPHISSSLA